MIKLKIFSCLGRLIAHAVLPMCLLSIIFFTSCKKDEIEGPVYNPGKPIVAQEFIPDSGGVGTKLIIRGGNFGSDTALVKVYVNNKSAKVIGVNDTHIYAVIPSRADTGKVKLVVGLGTTAQTFTFEKNFYYQFLRNVVTITGQSNYDGNGAVVDGTLMQAWFDKPNAIAVDPEGDLFVLEEHKGLRKVSMYQNLVSTPFRTSGSIGNIQVCAFSQNYDSLIISNDNGDSNNPALITVTRSNGFMNPKELLKGKSSTNSVAVNPVDGEVLFNTFHGGYLYRYNRETKQAVELFREGENQFFSLCFSKDGKILYAISEQKHFVMRFDYDLATKTLKNSRQFVGNYGSAGYENGIGANAKFREPRAGVCDTEGNLYIADWRNHCIRQVTPEGVVTTFAGTGQEGYLDGNPSKAKFKSPRGIAIDHKGVIYVADTDNHRIRAILIE